MSTLPSEILEQAGDGKLRGTLEIGAASVACLLLHWTCYGGTTRIDRSALFSVLQLNIKWRAYDFNFMNVMYRK